MERFAFLIAALDRSNSTLDKVEAMRRYFQSEPAEDCAWAVYFLAGGKPQKLVATRLLREAAYEVAAIPEWLFDECYQAVGDLAETIALLLPEQSAAAHECEGSLDHWMRARLLPLRALEPEATRAALAGIWAVLGSWQRFVFNKLITGGLRLGVSRQLVLRALSEASGVDARVIAQRIIGYTDRKANPEAARYRALVAAQPHPQQAPEADADQSAHESTAGAAPAIALQRDPATLLLPYPFYLVTR